EEAATAGECHWRTLRAGDQADCDSFGFAGVSECGEERGGADYRDGGNSVLAGCGGIHSGRGERDWDWDSAVCGSEYGGEHLRGAFEVYGEDEGGEAFGSCGSV